MRILQVCQRPQRRGAEVFASQLNSELARQGHEVATVYLYPHAGDAAIPPGPRDYLLNGDENHPLETLIGFRPALLRQFAGVLESFRPDITQVNGARTVKYGILSKRLSGVPTGPIVYRNIGAPGDWIRGIRRKLFYRLILKSVDGVAGISRGLVEEIRPMVPAGVPVTMISNGVDPRLLEPRIGRDELRTSTGTPLSSSVVLFVGSLTPEKRVDRLIDATREVRARGPDLHLWIVGEGPLRPALEARAESLRMEDEVRFFGSREDVGSYLAASDILALVSDTEGIPAVVLEAGAVGLPVVATRVGGVPECLRDEVTGLLVERDDTEGLVQALTRLARDSGLRERLGCRAKERVLELHSLERIAGRFLDFYRSVRESSGNGSTTVRGAGIGGSTEHRNTAASLFSHELRLLTLVARPRIEPGAQEKLVDALRRGVDWEHLLALAERHKLLPLLASHLRHTEHLPPVMKRVLQNAEFANGCWILEQTGQLVVILTELQHRGIIAVPYKGPALAAQLYGAGTLRPVGDIDIVVRPKDVLEARQALVELGYDPSTPIDDPDQIEFMVRNRYHERYEGENGTPLELHWGFTNRDLPFALELDEIFSRLDNVCVGGHGVPSFRSDDLLLILSVHGAKHRWDRLEWLAGVAQLIRTEEELDWNVLIDRAASLGVRRTLFLALMLAHDLLEAPVPGPVLEQVRSDRRIFELADSVIAILCRERAGWEVPELIQRDRFRIRLRERWRDRGKFLWHRATTPSDSADWHLTRIGPWMVPVHAFRRPLHVMGQLFLGVRALLP